MNQSDDQNDSYMRSERASYTPPQQQQPQQSFSNMPPHQEGATQHSKLGIASFVIALVSVLMIVVSIIIAIAAISEMANNPEFAETMQNIADAYNPANINMEFLESEQFGSLVIMLFGTVILMIGALIVSLVGAILGIVGVTSKNRRKVFAIIGLVLNGIVLLGGTGFFVLSISMGSIA